MKLLKYFSYFILGAFIIFVLIGQFFGQISYSSTILVNQPLEKTWDTFRDEESMSNWVKNFKSIEVIHGSTEVPGSQFKLIIEDATEEYIIIETVKEVISQELYSLELENEFLLNEVTYRFDYENGSTRITSDEKLEGKGILMKPIFVFMKGYFQNETQKSLDRLKNFLESQN